MRDSVYVLLMRLKLPIQMDCDASVLDIDDRG